MNEPGDNLLALAYRCLYTAVGSYVAASFAPRNPVRHMWMLGLIGTALGAVAAIATIPMQLGPAWYPTALAARGLPCTLWAACCTPAVAESFPRAIRSTLFSISHGVGAASAPRTDLLF